MKVIGNIIAFLISFGIINKFPSPKENSQESLLKEDDYTPYDFKKGEKGL